MNRTLLRLFSISRKSSSSSMPFYAVARGRTTGVFLTWPECEAQVKGFTGAIFKKFATKSQAEDHVAAKSTTPNTKRLARLEPEGSASVLSTSMPVAKKAKTFEISDPVAMRRHGKYDFMEDADGYVQVYTDGSCEGNGTSRAIAGLGVYFSEGHVLNSAQAVSGRATNNCGEIQAASLAIRLASEHHIPKLCINTDSQFLINSVTKWLPGWKRKGWKLASGQAVKNEIDFTELDLLLQNNQTMQIKWNYVKAHCGILGNERADELARQGGQMFKKGL